MINQLHTRERHGECDVWYFDASGFCLTPSIPYAWQLIGSVIEVPTSVHNRRLNVLGFLTRHNALVPYVIEGHIDTAVVIECFEQFSQQLNKMAYVFLDNSTVQIIIKYLPPYSPELNLIEILWRFMKYYWVPFSAYMSLHALLQAIEDILQRFGTDYIIAFEMK